MHRLADVDEELLTLLSVIYYRQSSFFLSRLWFWLRLLKRIDWRAGGRGKDSTVISVNLRVGIDNLAV